MISKVITATSVKNYPKKKRLMHDGLQELVKQYDVIALSKITKVRATQLMMVRKKFRDSIRIVVIKNKVAQRALEKVNDVVGLANLSKVLEGQCALMFTDMSPFKLNLLLSQNKVFLPAKAGDIAAKNIIIASGNTGIAPGPVLSEFKESNVPTKIEQGNIWVTRDTIAAKPGTVISHKLASLLSKLNIKPIEAGIAINCAITNGLFFDEEDLKIDLMDYSNKLKDSFLSAIAISLKAAYPTRETSTFLISEAQGNANALAAQAGYLSTDSTNFVLMRAETRARSLARLAAEKGYTPTN
ncbi:MAG TPA: 50S ribosomal protein L10 [Nitrososphaeraceae archaeon]|nr:50S ribosomal protein L10 [Nitrososphaeraceae archaeon]